jgi:general secretion pathway protein I
MLRQTPVKLGSGSAPQTRGLSFDGGFSLLEVLVALAVVAASVTALMLTLSTQVQISQRVSERRFAGMVASNVFAQTRMQKVMPSVGVSNGLESSGPYNFSWRLTVQNTDQASLRRLDVRISLQTPDAPEKTVLTRTEFISQL